MILTHIHLDHAGGAGLLLAQLPNATLTVHPRGARHIIDPGKLIASTLAVYGADAMERIFGQIKPVPRERVIETPHGSSIKLNGREFAFFDTPGHARHHVCVLDAKSGHLFAGDTFGLFTANSIATAASSFSDVEPDPVRSRGGTSLARFDPRPESGRNLRHALQPGARHRAPGRRHASADRRARTTRPPRARCRRGAACAPHGGRDGNGIGRSAALRLAAGGYARRGARIFAGDIELNAQGLASWLDTLEPD